MVIHEDTRRSGLGRISFLPGYRGATDPEALIKAGTDHYILYCRGKMLLLKRINYYPYDHLSQAGDYR